MSEEAAVEPGVLPMTREERRAAMRLHQAAAQVVAVSQLLDVERPPASIPIWVRLGTRTLVRMADVVGGAPAPVRVNFNLLRERVLALDPKAKVPSPIEVPADAPPEESPASPPAPKRRKRG